jgi:hypothetical protein
MLPTAEEVIADLTEREHAVIARQRRPVQVLALTGPPQAGQPMLVFAGG